MSTRVVTALVWALTLAHPLPTSSSLSAAAGEPRSGDRNRSPDRADRELEYRALCDLVRVHYPYLEAKGIDWDALCEARHREALDARSDPAFYAVLEALLRSLRDGQTALLDWPGQPERTGIGVALRRVEGRVVVEEVPAGFPADRHGIEPGLEVLRVDGETVDRVFEAHARSECGYSTPWQQELEIYRGALFLGEPGTEVALEVREPSGRTRTRWVRRPSREEADRYLARSRARIRAEPLRAKILSGNLGYLHVRTWDAGPEVIGALDAALAMLRETRGLILDLRGNPGGPRPVVREAARRFHREAQAPAFPSTTGDPRVDRRSPWHRSNDYPVYRNPMVVLIDESVGGTNHPLVDTLRNEGCLTVGRATSGSAGISQVFRLPSGARVRLTVDRAEPEGAVLFEGRGVPADVPARPTLESLAEGTDVVLERARGVLITQIRK